MQEAWIDELTLWLSGKGFERFEQEPGAFGDEVIRFKGAKCEVVVGREKLRWYVGLAPNSGAPVMLPKVWQRYLDGSGSEPENLDDLDGQVAFVYDRLDDVIEVADADDLVEKLRDINWEFVKARLGLDPNMPRFPRRAT